MQTPDSDRFWRRDRLGSARGQALLEFVMMAVMMLVLVFGLLDFGRAIYARQILINLSREAANLSSRGTSLADTLTAINASAAPLNLAQRGYLILTVVHRNDDGTLVITDQLAGGGRSHRSRVGSGVGNAATLPATSVEVPARRQSLYVAEVYHSYTPVSPLGRLLRLAIPNDLSDIAYF